MQVTSLLFAPPSIRSIDRSGSDSARRPAIIQPAVPPIKCVVSQAQQDFPGMLCEPTSSDDNVNLIEVDGELVVNTHPVREKFNQ